VMQAGGVQDEVGDYILYFIYVRHIMLLLFLFADLFIDWLIN